MRDECTEELCRAASSERKHSSAQRLSSASSAHSSTLRAAGSPRSCLLGRRPTRHVTSPLQHPDHRTIPCTHASLSALTAAQLCHIQPRVPPRAGRRPLAPADHPRPARRGIAHQLLQPPPHARGARRLAGGEVDGLQEAPCEKLLRGNAPTSCLRDKGQRASVGSCETR